MLRKFQLFAIALWWIAIAPVAAAEVHEHDGSAELIGHVHFPISCPGAQRSFDQSMAFLHSFWYEKAVASFAQLAQRDPNCEMAWWGQAISLWHPLWDRPDKATLARGRALLAQARGANEHTQREVDWLAALAVFYSPDDATAYPARVQGYEQAMAQLQAGSPDDPEATTFYALALLATAQALPPDKSHTRERKAALLLNHVLTIAPDHPGALHYLIHAYDSPPLAPYALAAARRYARIAPAVPHAQHMPSHIFTRLGLWDESIASNLAAEDAAKRFAVEMHLPGAWDEQLHAMDYLEYAYLQLARDREAQAVRDELLAISAASPANFKVAYAYAAVPARYAIERRQWAEAAALELNHPDFPWEKFPWAQAINEFARALGAARGGEPARATRAMDRLTALHAQLLQAGDAYWAAQVEIQRLAAAAWRANARGKHNEALVTMRRAADLEDASEKRPVTPGPIVPARELLGDLLLELDRPAEALAAYRAVLAESPNRLNSLAGARCAAQRRAELGKVRRHATQIPGPTAEPEDPWPQRDMKPAPERPACVRRL